MNSWRSGELQDWFERRRFAHTDFPLEILQGRKDAGIATIVPARGAGRTLGAILDQLTPLKRAGFLDELLVVTAASDPAAAIAGDMDVDVLDDSLDLGSLGPSRGKGDAVSRAMRETTSELVVLVDGDTENFGAHFVLGLVGPLLSDPEIAFVKGAFHRPLRIGDAVLKDEGGRVSELVARPLLNLFFSDLAGFEQPLAGEVAFRRSLVEDFEIPTGFGLEIAMLVDAYRKVGLRGLAQCDLGERHDANKTLKALVPMAHEVASAVLRRAGVEVAEPELLLMPTSEGLMKARVSAEERRLR